MVLTIGLWLLLLVLLLLVLLLRGRHYPFLFVLSAYGGLTIPLLMIADLSYLHATAMAITDSSPPALATVRVGWRLVGVGGCAFALCSGGLGVWSVGGLARP